MISKQGESSRQYEEFKEKVKQKKINILVVKKGDRVTIEKGIYFEILWPKDKLISDNVLNNNSMVAKLNYNQFSMLFTGDIEAIAEKQMLQEKKTKADLKATILKVAHHGSKSSSTKEFLEAVAPEFALIGVGKNNTFGHPNNEVLERLEQTGGKVFRTDLDGEITIRVNGKGKVWINKRLK